MWPHHLTEGFGKMDPIKQERVQGDRKGLMPECNGNWFVKSKATTRLVLKRSGWCGTPSLQQTGYLQKLSVVFYTSTVSDADQLQKLLPFDPKLPSTGFNGATNGRLGLSHTGNEESCSQMKWGVDCLLMVEKLCGDETETDFIRIV